VSIQFRYTPPKVDARLRLAEAGAEAVDAAAHHILDASQPLVPVEHGDLKASGHVETVAPLHARIVYDAVSPEGYPYGIRQHEDMSLNHPNGGQAKFLEQPMHTDAQEVASLMAAALRKAF